ncbi:hypothetical protein F4821DRAFT_224047 [Hypoxylon rubiginosum]|uniref:Uncharacterized protein n=1 Tax=Hypoxylon rubiginosum TaxID=110542 RepID=A0ACC0DHY3_9PEZI|nr:hypothetical protein F4821DRAFT_224047 [Hypoxylon rubiginosum]
MEHHCKDIDLKKEEYDQAPPENRHDAAKPPSTAPPRTCFVCRKTLLLSYFNCCAICLGPIECSRPQEQKKKPAVADCLPTTEPPRSSSLCLTRETSSASSSSSVTIVEGRSTDGNSKTSGTTGRHCDSTYCKYTHLRPLMVLFVLCEFTQFMFFLVSLNMALYCHDWLLLRYAGLILLQWWQIFMLSRQVGCQLPIPFLRDKAIREIANCGNSSIVELWPIHRRRSGGGRLLHGVVLCGE